LCVGYFGDRVSLLCPDQSGLQSSYVCFPCRWDNRCAPPCPAFIGWNGGVVSWNLLQVLTWNSGPPDLHLLNS
jgi:hypothetical protein